MERKICILVPLLFLLPPVCGQDLNLRDDNFIHRSNPMRTWSAAQDYCRKHYTDLVTIRDETENQDFFHGWIGLYREDSESKWKWSIGEEIANFTIWHDNEPVPGENCAFKYRGKRFWYADRCSVVHSFMCYDGKLLLVKESKTWEEALQHCRALQAKDPSKPATDYQNHRYDLATLLTEDDHAFVREKAQEAETGVWIGLRYLAGRWVWMGGEAVQYQNMESCPRMRSCGFLKQDASTIGTQNCNQKRKFLCYKKP